MWISGALYVSQLIQRNDSNIDGGRIIKYVPGEGITTFLDDVGTNGLASDAAGLLYAASHAAGGIITMDPENPGAGTSVLIDEYNGNRFNSPNDLAVRSDGTVYFTDPNYQCGGCNEQPTLGVYRLPPGGTPELLDTTQSPPNGIALSPDENTLYVGGSVLTAHPISADGSVGAGTQLGNINSTDGLGIDCAGNIYVALNQQSMVVVVDPSGNQLEGNLSVSQVTNIAFGGPENKTLFITNQAQGGELRAVEWDLPGYPY